MSGIALLLSATVAGVGVLGVTASPPYLASSGHTPFTTATVTAYVSGGSGSYTYSWTDYVDSGYGSAAVNTPSASSTSLNITGLAFGQQCSGGLTVGVLDTVTGQTAYAEVPFSHERT